ncbi:FAD-binding protein [Microscilla marina]|uniref:FAD binding domain protein n=1 Tax=Microscilla marina ATCC 23134 TaxID=313606 RepID=A1ZIJ3_MICM2|nr:FAD-binding protein [Microscilla marina]EAY29861.1 FAD binding domain protein [Microscilla marina ATCC 23134]
MSNTLTWKNWIKSHETTIPESNYYEPSNEPDIRHILEIAIASGLKVKMVGSGHSHSKVAQPVSNNILISPVKLSGELPNYSWLKPDSQLNLQSSSHALVRVKSGTQLRTINREILAPKGLGLINMGPFDGQTIGGVINTNTHGTGLYLPGFTDMVRSVEMLVVKTTSNSERLVETWVIEPTHGISDPQKFSDESNGKCLIQDNNLFYSVTCGYGLFGIVHSYTLEVRDSYWLDERFEATTWQAIKNKFNDTVDEQINNDEPPRFLHENHQVKIYVNTAECLREGGIKDDTHCRIDYWNEVPVESRPSNWENHHNNRKKVWPPARKNPGNHFGLWLQGLLFNISKPKPAAATVNILNDNFFVSDNGEHFVRGYKASAYYRAIRRLPDECIEYDSSLSDSEKDVDNTEFTSDPEANNVGTSIEFSVPIRRTIEAVEKALNFLSDLNPDVNFITPIGIRFTKESMHYLCPTYQRDSAFIEIVGFLPNNRANKWDDFKDDYHDAFDKLIDYLRGEFPGGGVRFHKGKYNTYNDTTLATDYPFYNTWVTNYHILNATGLFDCPNAARWNLDASKPATLTPIEAGIQMDNFKSLCSKEGKGLEIVETTFSLIPNSGDHLKIELPVWMRSSDLEIEIDLASAPDSTYLQFSSELTDPVRFLETDNFYITNHYQKDQYLLTATKTRGNQGSIKKINIPSTRLYPISFRLSVGELPFVTTQNPYHENYSAKILVKRLGEPAYEITIHLRFYIAPFVGNLNSTPCPELHMFGCEWEMLMSNQHRVPYFSIQDAHNDGYDNGHYCLGGSTC